MDIDEVQIIKLLEERAWRFFELHARQRILLFRIYLTISTALFISFFYLLSAVESPQKTHFLYWMLMLSALGTFLSTILFWLLDLRNRKLIENAISAIGESDSTKNHPQFLRFDILYPKDKGLITHKNIFNSCFIIVGFFSVLLTGISTYKYICYNNNCTSQVATEVPGNIDEKITRKREIKNHTMPLALGSASSIDQVVSAVNPNIHNIVIPTKTGKIIIRGMFDLEYIPKSSNSKKYFTFH